MNITEFVTDLNEAKKQKKKKKAVERISTGGKKRVAKFKQFKAQEASKSQAARATFGDEKQKKIAQKEIFSKTMNTIVSQSKSSAISKIESAPEFKVLKQELSKSDILEIAEDHVYEALSYKPISFFSNAKKSIARVSSGTHGVYKNIRERENKLIKAKVTYFLQYSREYINLKDSGLTAILADYLAGAFLMYAFTEKKKIFGFEKKQRARDLALAFKKYEDLKKMSPEATLKFINSTFPSFLKSSKEADSFRSGYITEKEVFETLLGRGIIFENNIQKVSVYKDRLQKSNKEGMSVFNRLMGGSGSALPTNKFIEVKNLAIIEKAQKKEEGESTKKLGKEFESPVKMVLEKIGIKTDKNRVSKFPDLFVTSVTNDEFKGVIKAGDSIEVKSGLKASAKTKPTFNTLVDNKIIFKDDGKYYFDMVNFRKKLSVFGIPGSNNVIFVKKGSGSNFLEFFKSKGATLSAPKDIIPLRDEGKITLKFKDSEGSFPLMSSHKKQKTTTKKFLRDRSFYFGGTFGEKNFFNTENSFKVITTQDYEKLFKRD